jgi:lipopolysaccharide transport system ATP-binding protein
MNTVIKVENLSKKYIISHQRQERYTALRDVMARGVKRMFNRGIVQPFKRLTSNSTVQQINNSTDPHSPNLTFQQSSSSTTEEFWALKDVNFEVKRGDRVGIIGRNGAGKTTLLKLLSRITEPTTGRITLKGRVASLLEVGTGLTYLNQSDPERSHLQARYLARWLACRLGACELESCLGKLSKVETRPPGMISVIY